MYLPDPPQLLSPVSAEMCGPIRATGLSYKDHAAELNLPHPLHPVLFFKPPTTLASPSEPIPIPPICQDSQMDYEVELALVLSRETRDVQPQDALDHVLGWTVANDLTARKWQGKCSQWGFCKGFDKFCPLGPCLVSPRLIPDPSVLQLTTHLNSTSMQSGSARKMIFPIPQIISFLSQGTTLPAGTVIITGTPPGIGDGQTPKVWLKDGDEVRCWISHGVGTLVNRIVYDGAIRKNRRSLADRSRPDQRGQVGSGRVGSGRVESSGSEAADSGWVKVMEMPAAAAVLGSTIHTI
ncbi:hypothetical protein JCM24511_00704 [Saitozyma sp. JCM 24511]|nr:hypothetical protein JCM24511_00704 [Saitozyma sp. JCM 24511]